MKNKFRLRFVTKVPNNGTQAIENKAMLSTKGHKISFGFQHLGFNICLFQLSMYFDSLSQF